MNVLFDTSPLKTGHAHRGIGMYTSQLLAELKKIPELNIYESKSELKNKEIDVIHYPYFDLFFHTLPLLRPAPKSIVTIHDVIPLEFKEFYPVGKRGTIAFYAQKLALSSVNIVITNSLSSQKSIHEKLKVPTNKIKPIYLAGNPEIKYQQPDVIQKVREKYSLPSKYILYVGDINYNKNIPQLIKALKYLDDDIHLVLFGKNFFPHDIPEWQWIETQLALSDVADRVMFLTNIDSNKELSALYSGAEVYVQPSLAEGFGLPILEAMQCKTLVVLSNVAALPEVGGNYAQYAEPEASSLAIAIDKQLALTPNERTETVHLSYKWAQSFSWEKTARETFEVYKSLV